MDRVLRCPGCGEEVVVQTAKNSVDIADAKRQSGFTPLLAGDMQTVWLCPACAEKASELAAEFFSIVCNQYVNAWFAITPEQRAALEM